MEVYTPILFIITDLKPRPTPSLSYPPLYPTPSGDSVIIILDLEVLWLTQKGDINLNVIE